MAFDKFITILLFFVINWGLGYSATYFLKNSQNFLERNIIRVGIGMGVFVILGIIINFLHIPLYWFVFLILSMILPLYQLYKHLKQNNYKISFPKPSLKISKNTLYILLVIVMFLILLNVMHKGTFASPWLEDGDSWGHMGYMRYVETQHTLFSPSTDPITAETDNMVAHYAPPYPPGYDMTIAMFSQLNSSPYWSMKFLNILIISLATLFFYFFVREFSGDSNIALFAAFILAILPSFMTHFIWSKSLGLVLFFPALYCISRIGDVENKAETGNAETDNATNKEKLWVIPSILVIAGILTTVPVTAFYFGALFFLYWLVKVIITRKAQLYILFAGIGGLLLSLVFWLHMLVKYGLTGVFIHLRLFRDGAISFQKIVDLHGTGGGEQAKYTFLDFFIVPKNNMINNPKGLGVFLTILIIIGAAYIIYKIIYKIYRERKEILTYLKQNQWLVISFVWLIFTLFTVLGEYFTVRMPYPFRAWAYLAIPVAIVGSLGYFAIIKAGKKIKIPALIILIIIIFGLLLTTGYQKYTVNTAVWQGENFYSQAPFEEVKPFLWMQNNLKKDTKMLSYCGDWLDVMGFDKMQEGWIPEVREFNKATLDMSVDDVVLFMKEYEYDYLIIDLECVKKYNVTYTNERMNDIGSSGKFQVAHQEQTGTIFKII